MLQDLSPLESHNILCGKGGDTDLALATEEAKVGGSLEVGGALKSWTA